MKPIGPDRPPARGAPSASSPGTSPSAPPSGPPGAPGADAAADASPDTSPGGPAPGPRPARWLWLAVAAMLIQQAFSYLSTLVLPIAAPAISEATGLGIWLVGVYTAVMYVASTL